MTTGADAPAIAQVAEIGGGGEAIVPPRRENERAEAESPSLVHFHRAKGGSCPTRSPLDVATQRAGGKHAVPVPTAYRLHGIPGNTPTGEPGLANRVLVSRARNRSCTRGRANMSMSQHSLPSLAASLEGPLSGRRSLPMCRVHAPRSRCSLRFAWRTPRRVCARTPPPYRPLVAGPLRESMS